MIAAPQTYLFFHGTGPDGRGYAKYAGRTTDLPQVVTFLQRERQVPWSTSYVAVVSYDTYRQWRFADEVPV